jgi:two-component system chemotaxis sensor kinase CheA
VADPTDKVREEFFSEAQELVENLSRGLLALDELQSSGTDDPAAVNETFRAVHTLKGLAGIFGAKSMGTISHRLEDVLDCLRLGRLPLTRDLLDVLFQAVEVYWQILAHEKDRSQKEPPGIETILQRLQAFGSSDAPVALTDEFEFEISLLSVLTEYEEHRLRSCVEQGLNLFRVRVAFELATIDKDLEEIKNKAKPLGEVITYLPTGESSSLDSLELDLLLASNFAIADLAGTLGGPNVAISAVPRRHVAAKPSPRDEPFEASMVHETSHPGVASLPVQAHEASMAPAAVMRSVSQSVRVDIRKLDALMNAVGELSIVKGVLGRIGERIRSEGNRQLGAELQRLQRTFDRRLSELQSGILEVRMVPLSQVFDRLTRVVRQIGRDVGKEIQLVITGGDTEIDKLIVEELSDPLMHIVRNAIDHGIESADKRRGLGKPEAGTIALNAFQKGNHVVLEVEDDGGGVNEQSLIDRAVTLSQISLDEARGLTRQEVLNLVFLPGLSTRDRAGDYSGRGVGMDVVKTNISKLGGVIDLQSERHIGTKITVTLPVTLAIVSALLIRIAGRTFAMPLTSVSEALSFEDSMAQPIDGRETMTLRGATLPLCRLDRFFQFDVTKPSRRRFVVVANMGVRRLGLVVDDLLGQQDIVIKALGRSLKSVTGFSGATELGDQRVALVLDVSAIIEEVLAGSESREAREVREVRHA